MTIHILRRSVLAACLFLVLSVPAAWAQDCTLFATEAGGGSGASFSDAATLSSALSSAAAGDVICAAAGRYTPTDAATGDRTATFALADGVTLAGGFSGTETTPVSLGDRPAAFLSANPTLLDGDFDDDSPTAIGDATASYDVVTINGVATLDGVIVTGGNDDRAVQAIGNEGVSGGVLINGPAADGATVINCILRDNDGSALQGGSISGFNAGYSLINSLVTETGGGATLQDIVAATGARQDLVLNPADLAGGVQTVTMQNVTIAGNAGTVFAEGQVNATVELVVDNSFIAENAEAAGGDPAESPAPGTSLIVEGDAVITNSVVEDAFVTECPTLASCVNVVEVLSSASGGSGDEALLSNDGFFAPQDGSPGREAGDNALLPADATDIDGDGDTAEALPLDGSFQARIEDGIVDAGWVEGASFLPVAPDIAATPAAVDFGDVPAGVTATETVTLENVGTEDLTITSIALSGPDAASFQILTGGTAGTLAPGATQAVEIEFAPATSASFSASLTVESDDPDESSFTVPLSGGGATSALTVGGDAVGGQLDFGDVAVGATSTLTLDLSNTGTAPLEVTALTIGGPNAGDFAIGAGVSLPLTIGPGTLQSVPVEYAPSADGGRSAELTIASNDPDGDTVVALVGGGAPQLALEAPAGTDIDPGDFFVVEVVAGSDVNPVPALFGVSAEIAYDPALFELQEFRAGDFLTNGGQDEVITFFNDDEGAGLLSWTVTRKDGQALGNVSGDGVVARLEFQVKDDVGFDPGEQNPLITTSLGLADVSAFDNASNPVSLQADGLDLSIVDQIEVFPGDTNNSGIVALDDIFPIGDCFLVATNTRDGVEADFQPPADIRFFGQQAIPSAFPAAGTPSNGPSPGSEPCTPAATDNPAYADADGDGEIDEGDIIAIGVHFSKETFGLDRDVLARGPNSRASLPSLSVTPRDVGSTFTVDVRVPEGLSENLYGVAASLSFPRQYLKVQSVEAGELIDNGNLLSLDVSDENAGTIRRAYTRKRGSEAVRGAGAVMSVAFETIAPIRSTQTIHLDDASLNKFGQGAIDASRGLSLQARDGLTNLAFSLEAFPNPVTQAGAATIRYSLPEATTVDITVYDLLGRKVQQVVSGDVEPGQREVRFDMSQLAAGSYFVRMRAGSFTETVSVQVVH